MKWLAEKQAASGKLRPWIAELVIRGIIPDRIGRYRILDILLVLAEQEGKDYE